MLCRPVSGRRRAASGTWRLGSSTALSRLLCVQRRAFPFPALPGAALPWPRREHPVASASYFCHDGYHFKRKILPRLLLAKGPDLRLVGREYGQNFLLRCPATQSGAASLQALVCSWMSDPLMCPAGHICLVCSLGHRELSAHFSFLRRFAVVPERGLACH